MLAPTICNDAGPAMATDNDTRDFAEMEAVRTSNTYPAIACLIAALVTGFAIFAYPFFSDDPLAGIAWLFLIIPFWFLRTGMRLHLVSGGSRLMQTAYATRDRAGKSRKPLVLGVFALGFLFIHVQFSLLLGADYISAVVTHPDVTPAHGLIAVVYGALTVWMLLALFRADMPRDLESAEASEKMQRRKALVLRVNLVAPVLLVLVSVVYVVRILMNLG